jgi:hypothetical protein
MSLKHTLLTLGGLCTGTATVAVDGPIGVGLVCGLLALGFGLITILALTGTFGQETRREAAQTVLAILLGRDQPRGVGQVRRRSAGS